MAVYAYCTITVYYCQTIIAADQQFQQLDDAPGAKLYRFRTFYSGFVINTLQYLLSVLAA